jgi:RNA polymerase sigma-32 factor
MTKLALPILTENGLSQYIEAVNKFPILDEKEEYMLAVRYKIYNDIEAAQKLVTSHLRLVVKIAMTFRGYGLPVNDIISEGNIGLMHAVKKFDPTKGFRLSTYAMWWIKASIHEHILKSWSIVKVGTSAAQKKLFYNLKRMKNKLAADSDNMNLTDANVAEIAGELDVTIADVQDMDRLMTGGSSSLNVVVHDDSEDEKINFIEDNSANQEIELGEKEETEHNNKMLYSAISKLNEREKDILTKRRLLENPLTLEDISQEYGISRERVRQIENRAIEKLQKLIGKPLAA